MHRLSSPPSCCPRLLLLLSLPKRSPCSTGTCSQSGLSYHTSSKQLTTKYYCYCYLLWPKPRRSENQSSFLFPFLVPFLFLLLCSCPSKFRRNSSVGLFLFLSFLFLFLFLFLSFICLFLESLCPWALGLLHASSNWPKSK